MQLFCTGKTDRGTPCGHVIDRPDHKKGWLVIVCVKCGKSTDHCPQPEKAAGTWLQRKPFGHLKGARA